MQKYCFYLVKIKKIKIFSKTLARLKKVVSLQRRNGRVVDRGGLENRCTAMYRGFESLFLRGDEATDKSLLFFNDHL